MKKSISLPLQFPSSSLAGASGVKGKVVHWVEHSFEQGLLYIHGKKNALEGTLPRIMCS